VSAHAPMMTNPEENRNEFHNKLKETVKNIFISDKLIIAGDFNAREGCEAQKRLGVIGTQGIRKCNITIMESCCWYFVLNTNLLSPKKYSNTGIIKLTDYVITRQKGQNNVLNTRAMRDADCSTDQITIRSKLASALKKANNKKKRQLSLQDECGKTAK